MSLRHFLPAPLYKFWMRIKEWLRKLKRKPDFFPSLVSSVVQVPPTPTAAPPCRRAPRCLVAAKTECTSAPSRFPAPTSGMKPSTPAPAAQHVRLATFSGPKPVGFSGAVRHLKGHCATISNIFWSDIQRQTAFRSMVAMSHKIPKYPPHPGLLQCKTTMRTQSQYTLEEKQQLQSKTKTQINNHTKTICNKRKKIKISNDFKNKDKSKKKNSTQRLLPNNPDQSTTYLPRRNDTI